MPSTVPFWIAFAATIVLLVAALFTGFTRRRRVHLLVMRNRTPCAVTMDVK
jgi:hypothetical protein